MTTTGPGAGDPSFIAPDERSVTWVTAAFAGIILAIVGVMQTLSGLAAVGGADLYADDDTYTYALDLTTWGWIHVAIGAVAMLIGLGIVARQTVAQAAGVAIAFLSACVNFVFIPYFPGWSLTLLALNVLVTWALTRQMEAGRARDVHPDRVSSRPGPRP